MRDEIMIFRITGDPQGFIETNNEIWLPWLKLQVGFVSYSAKQVPGDDQVIIIATWLDEDSLRRAEKKKDEIQELTRRLKREFSGTFRLQFSH